ncbi:MAG TPA: 50S ribosomal protein L18 [Candidatus Paceibacterota bacterium]
MRAIRKNYKKLRHERLHKRIRARVSGDATRPRLCVFKSNRFLSAQLIDDEKGTTLAAASTKGLKGKTPLENASLLGKTIAELAVKKSIQRVVFDRGGYIYAGKIKAVADGAREGGLKF